MIVDAISNLVKKGRLPANLLSTVVQKFCSVNKISYIPLYRDLNSANHDGKKTRWSYDGHLNELAIRFLLSQCTIGFRIMGLAGR